MMRLADANRPHSLKLPFLGPFRDNATKSWEYAMAPGSAPSQPVIAPNGAVYVGVAHSTAPSLYAITSDSALMWRADVVSGAPSTPLAQSDSSVVFGHFDFGTDLVTLSIGEDNLIVGVYFSRANPVSASSILAINKETHEIAWKYIV